MTTTTFLELALPALPSSVRRARVAAGNAIERIGGSERLADDVRLCVSEAVSNVVRHAYGTRRGDFEVTVEDDDGELSVVVRDAGQGMTGSGRPDRLGGYGLEIIDRMTRRYTIASAPNGGTEVRMVFGLRTRSESSRLRALA